MQCDVRATCPGTRAPGGRKVKGEREGCHAYCSAKCMLGRLREDRDRETEGQGHWGLGRGATEDEGERAHKGQGWAREREQRGGAGREGCLANCSAPCSRWPEGGGKEEEAREQKHAKHGPYARLV